MHSSYSHDSSIKLEDKPEDTVSKLSFSEQNNRIAASSWDGTLRIWDLGENYKSQAKPFIHKENGKEAILCCKFKRDGEAIYFGTTKGELKELSQTKTTATVIGSTSSPIACLTYSTSLDQIITGEWDGTISFFDPSSGGTSIATSTMSKNNKASSSCTLASQIIDFSLSEATSTLYIASTGGLIQTIDIRDPEKILESFQRLKDVSCITSIAASQTSSGYIAGTITGHIEANFPPNRYSVLKAHRTESNSSCTLYASNSVALSPERNIGISAGGDGQVFIFNTNTLRKIRDIKISTGSQPIPLTACAFAPHGNVIAVAQGYDWSKGTEYLRKMGSCPVEISIKQLSSSDLQ